MKTREEIHYYMEDLVQARIEELGLTQTEAAELCGTFQQMISNIKNHRSNHDFSIFRMARMLEDLGVDVDFQVNVKKEPSRRWQRRISR